MLLNTKNFGDLEVNEDEMILFQEGIPGFDLLRKFIIVKNEDDSSPFNWLQSVEKTELAFIIINPVVFKKDYTVEVDDLTINSLGVEAPEDVLIFSIVVAPEDFTKISANLKAPILINIKNKKGKQVILDNSEYHVRHYILEELRKQGE